MASSLAFSTSTLSDWLAQVQDYDVIVGSPSSDFWDLEETRKKYHFIETYLGKATYPSAAHMMLYEDKELEAYIAETFGIPFAKTYVSHDRRDAMRLIDTLHYPVVSKTFPASGSIGVELVRNVHEARRIVGRSFSNNGRKTHLVAMRQKNYVYFQQFIPNDGYDVKVMAVGKRLLGAYRRVPKGDFRALRHESHREARPAGGRHARGAAGQSRSQEPGAGG